MNSLFSTSLEIKISQKDIKHGLRCVICRPLPFFGEKMGDWDDFDDFAPCKFTRNLFILNDLKG